MNYTKEQEQAIFLRGKNIMVSAGAGAGKTRVLVSRMAELIMDKEHPIEADRFLGNERTYRNRIRRTPGKRSG